MNKPNCEMFPDNIYLFEIDTADGKPIYAVTTDVNDIPEDHAGGLVGVYRKLGEHEFCVDKRISLRRPS